MKIPVGDKKQFAHKILRLLEDERVRKALSREATRLGGQFDWDRKAKDALLFIKQLVA